jgi:hypothetical protein
VGKYHLGLITNAASDSCAIKYVLIIKLGMRQNSLVVLLPSACQRTYLTGESGCKLSMHGLMTKDGPLSSPSTWCL